MRTIHISAAAPRSLLLLLSSTLVVASLPLANAGTLRGTPGTAPTPYYGAFGLGQEQSISLASPARPDIDSLNPETLGDLMMIHQRYLAAIEAYQRGPHDWAVLWNKLGIAYQHLYALDIAKLEYEKSLTLNPNYPEALNNLGELCITA